MATFTNDDDDLLDSDDDELEEEVIRDISITSSNTITYSSIITIVGENTTKFQIVIRIHLNFYRVMNTRKK
jgi:hypothetical protein